MYLKKVLVLCLIGFLSLFSAQEKANRFFYELSFKPKKDSVKIDKVITILDITKGQSVYQDYTGPAQDSIMKLEVAAMQKSGVFKDIMKGFKMPKFSYKIKKTYPDMKIEISDVISTRNAFGYEEKLNFDWKISNEKQKIGSYNTQKATVDFGGRKWTAWFSVDLPFQDGPYKFYGLPGLIVKIEDSEKHYSWVLKGNKALKDWKELSYGEELRAQMGYNPKVIVITQEKFLTRSKAFKQDPFAETRQLMTPEMLSTKMPGQQKTIGDYFKDQEELLNRFFIANDNPIEKQQDPKGKKK